MERKEIEGKFITDFQLSSHDMFDKYLSDGRGVLVRILSGYYSKLLDINVPELIDKYNKLIDEGKYSEAKEMLEKSELKDLFSGIHELRQLRELIIAAHGILKYKKLILDTIKEKIDSSSYDENDLITKDFKCSRSVTYRQLLEMMDKAEKLASSKETYQLLSLVYKYSELKDDAFRVNLKLDDTSTSLKIQEVLSDDSLEDEIGIIKIYDTFYGIQHVAGTKREMALSDIVGYPYPKDQELRSIYAEVPNRIIVKTFHKGVSDTDKQMIQEKKDRLEKAKKDPQYQQIGFIEGCLISGSELLEHQIDTNEVHWKSIDSLKLSLEPTRKKRASSGMSFREQFKYILQIGLGDFICSQALNDKLELVPEKRNDQSVIETVEGFVKRKV